MVRTPAYCLDTADGRAALTSFLRELVALFAAASATTLAFAVIVRLLWRRGKHLEEP